MRTKQIISGFRQFTNKMIIIFAVIGSFALFGCQNMGLDPYKGLNRESNNSKFEQQGQHQSENGQNEEEQEGSNYPTKP